MDAQIAVGRLQQPFQIVECQPIVDRERADDAEPQPLVNQPIELQRDCASADFRLATSGFGLQIFCAPPLF